MSVWRRFRAAIGMGVRWAVGAFAVGLVVARIPGFFSDVPFAILFAPLGFASGIIFSLILVALARRTSIAELSLGRFAGWGAAAGLTLAGVLVGGAALRGEAFGSEAVLFAVGLSSASALCATGSLALAKRAEQRELLHGSSSNLSG
ncbi:MAG: hypothetical protein K2X99_11915 [Gemmatimonadaceae bacterium]|nr:hypothetical protein [Gemmatimonadaceae bacterium]